MDQNDCIPLGAIDCNQIEYGVRFRVTQPGFVTKIRFYKGTGQLGTRWGNLWDSIGNELTVPGANIFPDITLSDGWQEVSLTPAVHITPTGNYVASVFADVGDYQSDLFGDFNWRDSPNPLGSTVDDFGTDPIRVLRAPGHTNGLYVYMKDNPFRDSFPTSNNSINFWVDIRFIPDALLPVNITDFKATTANSDILLSWKTQIEQNNRGFEIQRSNNGTDWYPLRFVNGAGESTILRNYSYTDNSLAPGQYYYRLKQVDNDGKYIFSTVLTATVSGKGNVFLYQNSPNPFSTSTTIRFDLPRAQKVRLSVFDMTGREIKVLTDNMSETGSHLVTLNTLGLSKQLYFVRLKTEDGILTEKILVQ
jgi:hypothetical protein